ncbi:MAG: hypothetical protein H7345_00400 [Rubritepida sp.]|nr:hypothetical protein [Rubritepida sp.]
MISDPLRLAIAPAHVWRDTPPPDGGSVLMDDSAMPIAGHITFDEALRALNPLHHIPIIGTIYRAATGETIQPALRVLGGFATGGPLGAITAAIGAFIEETRPLERIRATMAGLPDPGMATAGERYALATTPAEATAAYRRWTAPPQANTALA